jgi:hypothetical protein
MITSQTSALMARCPYPFLASIVFLSDWKAAFAVVLARLPLDMNHPAGGARVMVR